MVTNDATGTREIKSRIAMAKATLKRKKTIFTRKMDLNVRKKLVKFYIWGIAFYGDETWTLESRSAIPATFLNVVLEKDGEDLLDCWCEKLRITKSQGGIISYIQ
jgi:hypothetical protein